MVTYRVHCSDCGWIKEFDEGALRRDTPLEESAKKRRAGHLSANDCPPSEVSVQRQKPCGEYHALPCGSDRECPEAES